MFSPYSTWHCDARRQKEQTWEKMSVCICLAVVVFSMLYRANVCSAVHAEIKTRNMQRKKLLKTSFTYKTRQTSLLNSQQHVWAHPLHWFVPLKRLLLCSCFLFSSNLNKVSLEAAIFLTLCLSWNVSMWPACPVRTDPPVQPIVRQFTAKAVAPSPNS